MKQLRCLLCLLCALLLLLPAGCGGSDPPVETTPGPLIPENTPAPTARPTVKPTAAPTPEPTPEPTEEPVPTESPEPEFYHPLTGVPTEEDLSMVKPVAVMLNNIKAAMPMQGNSQADILYEVLAEGGITRMLGIYLTPGDVGIIGSVRSARQYFWELARGHDAVYIHAGGSTEFYNNKAAEKAFTVDGVNGSYSGASAGMFWRDRDRIEGKHYATEHSLLTSGENIKKMQEDRGLTQHKDGYVYEMNFADDGTPAGGENATKVVATFSSKKTIFQYDEESKTYLVEEYDAPFEDGNDGTQVAVTNVLVLRTSCKVYDSYGRITVNLTSGSGWFACGGKIIPIKWEKNGKDNQLKYTTEDGDPLTLGRGKIFVCIIPLNHDVSYE